LVHGQVTIIFVVSVCLFVCAGFFSAVFDPIWIKLGHMTVLLPVTKFAQYPLHHRATYYLGGHRKRAIKRLWCGGKYGPWYRMVGDVGLCVVRTAWRRLIRAEFTLESGF